MAADPIRASDSERERVAQRLRDAAAQGRLTMDELDERLAGAYVALTRGELAALLADLPAPVEPPLPAPPAPRRPWLPGRYAFTTRWSSPTDRLTTLAELTEIVAPPMHRYGYDLVERTGHRLVFERRTWPLWTLLPAIFLFPFGLLALAYRSTERIAIELVERRGETLLIAQGVAPLAVRRAFAELRA